MIKDGLNGLRYINTQIDYLSFVIKTNNVEKDNLKSTLNYLKYLLNKYITETNIL